MPLPLPELDDRSYDSLVEELRGLIPAYAPEWTNHNPSDPGITLIELFAYYAEMLLYRLDRVTEASQWVFLRLLNGPDWKPDPDDTLAGQIRKTVLSLRRPGRAVTMLDFETLALAADPGVARARALPRRNFELTGADRYLPQPGHVSVLLAPAAAQTDPAQPPDATLLKKVLGDLDQRRLLATVVHVVAPRYLKVGVLVTVILKRNTLAEPVTSGATRALRAFANPVTGGPDGHGWPFGRDFFASDVYRILDDLPGVDYVRKSVDAAGNELDELTVADPARLVRKGKDVAAVKLQPDELLLLDTINITVQYPEARP